MKKQEPGGVKQVEAPPPPSLARAPTALQLLWERGQEPTYSTAQPPNLRDHLTRVQATAQAPEHGAHTLAKPAWRGPQWRE